MKNITCLIGVLLMAYHTAYCQASDDLKKAKQAMQDEKYDEAIKFGKRAWRKHPDRYVAYLLASAYFNTGDYAAAQDYIKDAYDSKVPNDTPLDDNKNSQLKYFKEKIDESLPKKGLNQEIIIKTKSVTESQTGGDGGYSLPTKTKDVDLQRAQLARLNKGNIISNEIPNQLIITWVDSTKANMAYPNKISPDTLVYGPELSKRLINDRLFLLPRIVKVFFDFQNGQWDSNAEIVKDFGLTKMNVNDFCKDIFPEVYDKRGDLKKLYDQLEWLPFN